MLLNINPSIYQDLVDQKLSGQYPAEQRISAYSRQLFDNALRRGRMALLRKALLGSEIALKDLNQVAGKDRLANGSRHPGVRSVLIDQIVGSEGRSSDFDRDFNPLKPHINSRWQRVASAREDGLPLPPIELVRIGSEYYVRDGHHRISVARARGEKSIEAVIVNI